jgi:hypothetical protein
VTSELSTRSAFVLSNDFRRLRCAILECASSETDRLSSPYQLEEPSSRTNPRLTPLVVLQAPPANSKSAGSSSCSRSSLARREKQAVLTCKTRDASPRLGEELGIDTPRRLLSCHRQRDLPCGVPRSRLACPSGRRTSEDPRTVSPRPISHVASTRDASFTLAETPTWNMHPFGCLFGERRDACCRQLPPTT